MTTKQQKKRKAEVKAILTHFYASKNYIATQQQEIIVMWKQNDLTWKWRGKKNCTVPRWSLTLSKLHRTTATSIVFLVYKLTSFKSVKIKCHCETELICKTAFFLPPKISNLKHLKIFKHRSCIQWLRADTSAYPLFIQKHFLCYKWMIHFNLWDCVFYIILLVPII